jgi:transposase, mutator family
MIFHCIIENLMIIYLQTFFILSWNRIQTNNTIGRVNRENKRRTKAIGAFPDGQSSLMLVCARLRHVAASNRGTKRYLNMNHLFDLELQCKADGQFTAS